MSEQTITENNSGMGKGISVSGEVANRFNWGAFFLSWIWGLGNNSFITFLIWTSCLIIFIPLIGIFAPLGFAIWFGIKGNEWAWQNKHFESIEKFHDYQRKWATAGVIVSVIFPVLIGALTLPVLLSSTSTVKNHTLRLKEASVIQQATMMLEALEQKCELSSAGLAQCFEKRMNIVNRDNNVIKAADGTIWTFEGNGVCKNAGECKVIINSGDSENDEGEIPLYVSPKGFVYVEQSDLDKYKGE